MSCQFGRSYIIQSGEILYNIAQRELGNGERWREIRKLDGSTFTEDEARNLQSGQEVCLPVDSTSRPTTDKLLVGYFQSWSENQTNDPNQLQLANLASYINMVVLSFLKPDVIYNGNYDLANTGLCSETEGSQPVVEGVVLKDAIALLKARNPKTKVLVSIGGDNYQNFANLNTNAIVSFIKDFGLDGVDIDYLPTAQKANCSTENGQVSCGSDAEYRRIVREIRQALPKPFLVTVTGWSVGAYGQGKWANSQPRSEWTGLLVNLLKSPEANEIDQINVTSYNAGFTYNPIEALEAYQHYFKGKVVMAVHVPPEGWGGHIYTLTEVRQLAQAIIDRNGDGIMLWSIQRQPDRNPSDDYPNAQMITREICQQFSLGNCEKSIF